MVRKHLSKISKRTADTHKGDFGHVLVIAGSKSYTGAAYLASQAAIVSGSGLVTLGIPESLHGIFAVKLTEVMLLCLPETAHGGLSVKAESRIGEFSKKADVLAIGPGLGISDETARLVRALVAGTDKPVVLDADGITSLNGHQDVLKKRKSPTVLTPHPGEMARLIKKDIAYVQKNRETIAKSFSLQYNCVLILKGHRTVVADPRGEIYINDTGNSGMSTAGMGDVLTGVVSSLIAQGLDPYSASVIAVYIHGKAGDAVAAEKGEFGLLAGDVLERVPYVLKDEV